MKIKKTLLFYVSMVVILVVAGCSNISSDQVISNPSASSQISSGGIKEFNVKAFRFGFEPNTIKVSQGDRVKITAQSVDVPHGFTIDGYGINLYLDGLRPQTAEFVADKAGTYRIFCSVPCGAGHSSMRGSLIVE